MPRCLGPILLLLVVAGCEQPPVPVPASPSTEPVAVVDVPTPPTVPAPKPVEPKPPVPPVEPKPPAVKVDLKLEKQAEAYAIQVGGTPLRNVSHIGEKNALITVNFLGTDAKPADVKAVDLKKLAGATRLNRLGLLGSKNTDACLKEVAALPMLKSISLEGSDVSDAGLAAIAALPNLIDLDLSRVKTITPAGWKSLGNATKLETLRLSHSGIDDAAFKELAALKGLKSLKLDGTNLTLANTGATFAQFKQLVELDLNGSPISDEGVLALCAARALVTLETGTEDRRPDFARGTEQRESAAQFQQQFGDGHANLLMPNPGRWPLRTRACGGPPNSRWGSRRRASCA